MTAFVSDNSDFEQFAKYLGIQGSDVVLFYDTYYQLDTTEIDMEYDVEERAQCRLPTKVKRCNRGS